MDTKGALGTASRWGWHDGGGPQLPNAPAGEASRWKLATLEWGAASGGSSPTASPTVSWGRFGYGWRGHEGEAADGAKLGPARPPTHPCRCHTSGHDLVEPIDTTVAFEGVWDDHFA